MMVKRISLDKTDVTLKSLFEMAEVWKTMAAHERNEEQNAILKLKSLVESKLPSSNLKGGGYDCFICVTGA